MPEVVTGYEHKFRPAVKSAAKPLIGLYALSGAGKTFSALLMARGFAGKDGHVGMIETESGRGEAYVDLIPGGYDVLSITGDYSPRVYGEAISAAEKAGLSALIVDSASHEWESYGGVLHMAALNEEAGKKGQLVWKQPKMDHERHFMQRVRGTAIPLVIVCMRAKYPMREIKVDGKKEWARSDDLVPKQSDDILSEMFVNGWIDAEHRFHGTKYTTPEWRQIIVDGEPISLETGQRIAAWAKGLTAAPIAAPVARAPQPATPPTGLPSRAAMLAAIVEMENALHLSGKDRLAVWTKYCGEATETNVDVAALADLATHLRAQARERGAA